MSGENNRYKNEAARRIRGVRLGLLEWDTLLVAVIVLLVAFIPWCLDVRATDSVKTVQIKPKDAAASQLLSQEETLVITTEGKGPSLVQTLPAIGLWVPALYAALKLWRAYQTGTAYMGTVFTDLTVRYKKVLKKLEGHEPASDFLARLVACYKKYEAQVDKDKNELHRLYALVLEGEAIVKKIPPAPVPSEEVPPVPVPPEEG